MAAYTLIATSTGVQIMGSSGTLTTLTLPTGVTATGLPARFARLNNRIVITGCVSVPIWVGQDLQLRVLSLPTPTSAPVLTTGTGTYTGTRKARVSYLLRDDAGNILAESPLGPASAAVTFTNQGVVIGSLPIPLSGAPVTDRRIYLTATGGSTYFLAFDVEGITETSVTTSIADASLSNTAASADQIAAPTDLDLVTVWKNRLFGRSQLDLVVGSTPARIDQWPNSFPVDQGTDSYGITGFLARRDELGIGRRDKVWKLTGTSEDDFALVKESDGKGIIGPDTCIVVRDIGYFLSDDGFYSWGPGGVKCLTDERVRPWFTTDTYFNRARFPYAFSRYDPVSHRISVHLAAAGSSVNDRWIDFDIETGAWYGPHKCGAVTNFTAATIAPDSNNVLRSILAADDGYLYTPTSGSATDGASTAIDFDVYGKFHMGNTPDDHQAWLQLSVFTAVESGGTLTITPTVGDLESSAGTAMSHDLTKGRERLGRPGVGRLCQLRFRENTAGQKVQLYGYELPFLRLGRR